MASMESTWNMVRHAPTCSAVPQSLSARSSPSRTTLPTEEKFFTSFEKSRDNAENDPNTFGKNLNILLGDILGLR